MKCQACGNNPATFHLTEIEGGEKREKHLCEGCAAKEGLTSGKGAQTLNEWLTNFVTQQAGGGEAAKLVCRKCGMSFGEFRQRGLLGCPSCYSAFEKVLLPLMERAHESASHHIGKVPANRDRANMRQYELVSLRRQLRTAVETEDYEQAAKLRDQIRELEN